MLPSQSNHADLSTNLSNCSNLLCCSPELPGIVTEQKINQIKTPKCPAKKSLDYKGSTPSATKSKKVKLEAISPYHGTFLPIDPDQ